MRCQICGEENPDGVRFCSRCGQNLSPEPDPLVAGVDLDSIGADGAGPAFGVLPGMVTTGFGFEGHRITHYQGVVRGLTVRSRSALGNFAGQVQSMFGGSLSIYVDLCEKARDEAYELMVQHANQLNANAIIGMRYDANDVMDGITEVLAYGTAVITEPESAPDASSV